MEKDSAASVTNNPITSHCPCGSLVSYQQCCQPAINGSRPAATAEALMRSRYSAYALGEVDYLIATTHPDFRQGLNRQSLLEDKQQIRWLQLQIISAQAGAHDDDQGEVSFIATFSEQGHFAALQERSRFLRIDQRWYYCDGHTSIKTVKPERNAPCLCGSGRKFKRCCG
ncbi:MAG: YchJ family protein [Halopseudomonas sp.]